MPRRVGHRRTDVAQPLDEFLFRCWVNGKGIGSTIADVAYSYGLTLPFETVRQVFIRCCDRFSGGSFD